MAHGKSKEHLVTFLCREGVARKIPADLAYEWWENHIKNCSFCLAPKTERVWCAGCFSEFTGDGDLKDHVKNDPCAHILLKNNRSSERREEFGFSPKYLLRSVLKNDQFRMRAFYESKTLLPLEVAGDILRVIKPKRKAIPEKITWVDKNSPPGEIRVKSAMKVKNNKDAWQPIDEKYLLGEDLRGFARPCFKDYIPDRLSSSKLASYGVNNIPEDCLWEDPNYPDTREHKVSVAASYDVGDVKSSESEDVEV